MELVGRMRGALQLFADSHFERASDLLHVQKLVVETSVFDDRRVGEVECFEYTGVLIDVVLGTEADFREGASKYRSPFENPTCSTRGGLAVIFMVALSEAT
jgi:hypothetical protein